MVDIYCNGGAFLGVDMDYAILAEVMRDNIIKPNDLFLSNFLMEAEELLERKA